MNIKLLFLFTVFFVPAACAFYYSDTKLLADAAFALLREENILQLIVLTDAGKTHETSCFSN